MPENEIIFSSFISNFERRICRIVMSVYSSKEVIGGLFLLVLGKIVLLYFGFEGGEEVGVMLVQLSLKWLNYVHPPGRQ